MKKIFIFFLIIIFIFLINIAVGQECTTNSDCCTSCSSGSACCVGAKTGTTTCTASYHMKCMLEGICEVASSGGCIKYTSSCSNPKCVRDSCGAKCGSDNDCSPGYYCDTIETCTCKPTTTTTTTTTTTVSCQRNPPSVIPSPYEQGTGSATVSYTITVKNNDQNCGSSNFELSITNCPSGWQCVLSSTSFSLSSGGSTNVTLNITPASEAYLGGYVISINAKNQNSGKNASSEICTSIISLDPTYSPDTCPGGAAVTREEDKVYHSRCQLGSENECVNSTLILNPGEEFRYEYAKLGESGVNKCQCHAVSRQICTQRRCLRWCSNGVCLSWGQSCSGQQVTSQCDSTSDRVGCSHSLNTTIRIRKKATTNCIGEIVFSEKITGKGIKSLNLNAPLQSGEYELCREGSPAVHVKYITVPAKNEYCSIEGPDEIDLPIGVTVKTFNLTSINTARNYQIYNYTLDENQRPTINPPHPQFIKILDNPVFVPTNQTREIRLQFNVSSLDAGEVFPYVHLNATNGTVSCDVSFTIRTRCCDNNTVCDPKETQENCPEDCKTFASIYPTYVYPGQQVTITIYFNDSRFNVSKSDYDVKFDLFISNIPWNSTNGCDIGGKKLRSEMSCGCGMGGCSGQHGHHGSSEYWVTLVNGYAKINATCKIPQNIPMGPHTLKVIPVIYSSPTILTPAETVFEIASPLEKILLDLEAKVISFLRRVTGFFILK